jgi:hypothetical protein
MLLRTEFLVNIRTHLPSPLKEAVAHRLEWKKNAISQFAMVKTATTYTHTSIGYE